MNKICLKNLWGCVNKVCGEGLWVAKIKSNPGVRSNPESNPESNPDLTRGVLKFYVKFGLIINGGMWKVG